MSRPNPKRKVPALLFMPAAVMIALAGCGGGDGGGGEPPAPAPAPSPGPSPSPSPSPSPGPAPAPSPTPTPPPPATAFTGTVASGGPLSGAVVTIKDKSGSNACKEDAVTASEGGSYTCSLADTAEAPFAVLAVDPSGAKQPLASLATTRPAANTVGTLNITQVTTAILSNLSPDGNPFTVVESPANYASLTTGQLQGATAPVVEQLSQLAQAAGVTSFDPFAGAFTADQTGVDALLDRIRYEFWQVLVNSKLRSSLFSVTQPAGNAVYSLATTSPATPIPAQPVPFTPADLAFIKNGFTACFAVPAAQRALAKNDAIAPHLGGPEVTALDPGCQNIAHASFVQNGYRFGQFLYGALNDPDMDGARFFVPEIVRVNEPGPASDPQPRVTLNIKFVNNKGIGGSWTMQARKFASANRWFLWGNQRLADFDLEPFFRRRDQLAAAAGAPSGYESGVRIAVSAVGPGSIDVRAGSPTNGQPLRAVRVKGVGLPTNGITLTRPDNGVCDQSRFVIANKNGDVTVTSAGNNGSLFGMQRADANGAVIASPTAVNWANTADYATAAEFPIFGNGSNVNAFRSYTFEFFYGSDTTTPLSLALATRAAVDSTTIGPKLKWNAPTAPTLQLLDPAGANAGSTATMNIAWTRNVVADAIHEVGVFTTAGGARVDQPSTRVAQGSSTSVTVNAPSSAPTCSASQFPALDASGNTSRTFRLNYKALNGATKFHDVTYN